MFPRNTSSCPESEKGLGSREEVRTKVLLTAVQLNRILRNKGILVYDTLIGAGWFRVSAGASPATINVTHCGSLLFMIARLCKRPVLHMGMCCSHLSFTPRGHLLGDERYWSSA